MADFPKPISAEGFLRGFLITIRLNSKDLVFPNMFDGENVKENTHVQERQIECIQVMKTRLLW